MSTTNQKIPLLDWLRQLDSDNQDVQMQALAKINQIGPYVFQTMYRQHCLTTEGRQLNDRDFATLDRGGPEALPAIASIHVAWGGLAFSRLAGLVERKLKADASDKNDPPSSSPPSRAADRFMHADPKNVGLGLGVMPRVYKGTTGLYNFVASSLCGAAGGAFSGAASVLLSHGTPPTNSLTIEAVGMGIVMSLAVGRLFTRPWSV